MATASAMAPCTIVVVEKQDLVRQLHAHPAFAGQLLTHMLTKNIRIEEDLIDQLFNSSEKRLARTLLLLAHYGEPEAAHRVLPRVSQETLAEMVATNPLSGAITASSTSTGTCQMRRGATASR